MDKKIDPNKIFESAKNLPPSPRDPKIKNLGIATFVFYALAGVCAWQIGAWWGIGLIVSIFIIDTLNDFVAEEHRQELVEMNGKLIREIAESSDVLDHAIPKKSDNEL